MRLADLDRQYVGVGPVAARAEDLVGGLVVFERDRVLALPQIDVADGVARGGRAYGIVGLREERDRVLELRQRLVGAVEAQMRATGFERGRGLRGVGRRVGGTGLRRGDERDRAGEQRGAGDKREGIPLTEGTVHKCLRNTDGRCLERSCPRDDARGAQQTFMA
jgi:hypothetical protein